MKNDINQLRNLCLNKDKEKIQEFLEKKSKEELLNLFEHLIDNNPFLYKLITRAIIGRLYSDDNSFVKLLSTLIEKTHFGPDEDVVLERPSVTVAVSEKIMDMGIRPGFCSGILVSPLMGKGIIDETIMQGLGSNNVVKQVYSLTTLHAFFFKKDEESARPFIARLLETARDIDPGNTDLLIRCLVRALQFNKEDVLPVLEMEIDQRGYTAASTFIQAVLYQKVDSVDLLKKAISIIEAENPDSDVIDEGLGLIYEHDPDYVVERLRTTLKRWDKYPLARDGLVWSIQTKGVLPVIKMLDEEIDSKNPAMIQVGESILEDFFDSSREWLDWCKKWKDDEKKEKVVLKSVAEILTKLITYAPDGIRDEAISLIREFAEKKGLDYDEETKGVVDLGKDTHEGAEYKEATIKALYLARQMINPPKQIDIAVLQRNLKNYPYLSKAIGAGWLVRNAKSDKPHLLAYLYDEEPDHAIMNELIKQFNAEKDEQKKSGIAWRYQSYAHVEQVQSYWEQVFKTLDEHNLKIRKSKLRNPDNADSILAEGEVIARLAPYFNVEIEPPVEGLDPKKLDARIEFNGQEALVEIAVVRERIEVDVAQGGISIPGGKAKRVLLDKFKGQLKAGEVDLCAPVVIIFCMHRIADFHEVENAIYGQFKIQYKTRTDTRKRVEEGYTRADNSFYDEENAGIVSAIGAYKSDYTKKDPLVGRLHRPPLSADVKNPLNREFRLKLRNALFGTSENSSWQTLMKIEGINEKIAKKMHSNGIEDIGTLANVEGEDLSVDGFTSEQLFAFQKEARRIVMALQTGSIRYLKGIDQNTYDILTKKGIYLITQLTKLTEIPEDIDSSIWGVIIDDARKIIS